MGKLLNKLRLKLIRLGFSCLEKSDPETQDNLDFVKEYVRTYGGEEFQYASDWLRSDASSILELVEIDPEVLSYTSDKIYDRYVDYDHLVEDEEVNYLIFGLLCVEKDEMSIAYLNKDVRERVMKALEEGKVIYGKFNGENIAFDPEKSKIKLNSVSFINNVVENKIKFL